MSQKFLFLRENQYHFDLQASSGRSNQLICLVHSSVHMYRWRCYIKCSCFKISNDVFTFLKGDPIQQKCFYNEKESSSKSSTTQISSTSINDSIICFHCNHGKGRTGTAIISLLLLIGFEKSAKECLDFYNSKRFNKCTYGVDQPCQLRYLNFI